MRVLEKRAACKLSYRRKPRSERIRPVRHGKCCIIGSNQSAGDKKKHRPRHYKLGEPVNSRVIRCRHSRNLTADYSSAATLLPPGAKVRAIGRTLALTRQRSPRRSQG